MEPYLMEISAWVQAIFDKIIGEQMKKVEGATERLEATEGVNELLI